MVSLSIKAQNHKALGTLEFDPFVSFDPLAGRLVDKVAGELIKRHLDQIRGV